MLTKKYKQSLAKLEFGKEFLTPLNIFVFAVLVLAFMVRVWRIDQTLGFYYDQGRDALVIWDLFEKGKLFLIGPTTGIAGIFRGPFYYYLIAPFYLLGQGNPLFPEVFLILTSVTSLLILFIVANKTGGVGAGIISLILASFSYEIIFASRWLSNPTPMLLISMLVLLFVYKIYDDSASNWIWVLLAFLLGISLFHFGSSGELFYFPAIAIALLWKMYKSNSIKKVLPPNKVLVFSALAFTVTILPLILFNFKHDGLLAKNIQEFVFGEKTFSSSGARFIYERFFQLLSYFYGLIFHSPYEKEVLWLIALGVFIIYNMRDLFKNEKFQIILFFLLSPILGLLFFQGNFGNVYGYYLTGYYLIFLIFIGVSLAHIFQKSFIGKIFVLMFIYLFLTHNWFWTRGMINTKVTDESIIVLGTQKMAIDWIHKNADKRQFNVDVYVPPVIPHAYDYLFKWYPSSSYKKSETMLVEHQVPLLYTLYEIDPDHPDRLKAWLERQDGIGSIIKEQRIGGIIVQERERIKK